MKRLAIITTHPIQYNAPLFHLLAVRKQIEIKVFYTWGKDVLNDKYDPGFGKPINWDIPLLDGYNYEFLENIARDKGSHHFKGIMNPEIIPSVKRFEPDAILVYGWAFSSHLKIMRYFKGRVPVLFRGDSTLLDDAGLFRSVVRNIFLRWVYSYVDIALYVGTNNLKYFKKAGLKSDQLVFSPHAVDNKRFECNSTDCLNKAILLRRGLNIPSAALVFLFAGKLEPKKGVELLLATFIQCNFNESVHLIIVGNGPLETALKSTYSARNINYVDFQNQSLMPSIYTLADVFVLPSKGPGETWGLAVNEAMANGKAVLVSDKCGCAVDLVHDGQNGFIFKSGEVEDLKRCILKLTLLTGKDHISFKQRSKQIIENFSMEMVAVQIEKIVNH